MSDHPSLPLCSSFQQYSELLRPIAHVPIHIFQVSSHCYRVTAVQDSVEHTFTAVLGAESKHGLL